jgi:hypothetical protein
MKKPTKKGALTIYKSYNFVDKDPAIDVVRTMVQQSKKSYRQIHADGGPTPGCLTKWFDGGTKRPQFCTLAASVRALGGDVIIMDSYGAYITPGKGQKGLSGPNKSVQQPRAISKGLALVAAKRGGGNVVKDKS